MMMAEERKTTIVEDGKLMKGEEGKLMMVGGDRR